MREREGCLDMAAKRGPRVAEEEREEEDSSAPRWDEDGLPAPASTFMDYPASGDSEEEHHSSVPRWDEDGIPGIHGSRFMEYTVNDTSFHLTSKYKPPFHPIGQGAFGFVCSAWNSKTQQHSAIKKVPQAFDNLMDARRILREIKLLAHMDHENVIAIQDIIPPPSRHDFNDVYIAFQKMDTDLQQITNSIQCLTEQHSQYFLYQILRGLKYVHSANVIHRDLKPSNLLVNANCDLKICDFGMARSIRDAEFMTEYVVTRWYRAPELLLSSTEYTTAIDVWAVGCIYMELLNGTALFPGRDYCHQIKSIVELLGLPDDTDLRFIKSENARRYLNRFARCSRKSLTESFPKLTPLALDLVERMLVFDPNQRITVEDALAHPYLSYLHDESDEPTCPSPFTFDFEEHLLTVEQIKDIIYKEALTFNPI